jgi:hypothetical protein
MTRALLTDRQREILADPDVDPDRRYQAVSRIRRRIQNELREDCELLEEHHPDLYTELLDVVCDEADDAAAATEANLTN